MPVMAHLKNCLNKYRFPSIQVQNKIEKYRFLFNDPSDSGIPRVILWADNTHSPCKGSKTEKRPRMGHFFKKILLFSIFYFTIHMTTLTDK